MLKFFRNPEIRQSLLWHLFLFLFSLCLSYFFPSHISTLWFMFSLLYIASHYWITWRRYRRLEQLGQEIDDMLHHQIPIHFEKYREGELSILENELSKMTLRLSEQAAALAEDKQFLADSMADIDRKSVV